MRHNQTKSYRIQTLKTIYSHFLKNGEKPMAFDLDGREMLLAFIYLHKRNFIVFENKYSGKNCRATILPEGIAFLKKIAEKEMTAVN